MDEIIAGKYRILELIGSGGMGKVYRAAQIDLNRAVAVKVLSPSLAEDPEFLERFRQEAAIIARLSHPNIVNVITIETLRNTFCIIMEFLEGETLQNLVDINGPLPPNKAAVIGGKAADALHHAHEKGVIHRDVKPDNIMILPDESVKVTDFGIARWGESSLKTRTGISMGTPKFMSPEQARGKNIDRRSDVYSLGLTLYYITTGRPAFDANNAVEIGILQEQPVTPPSSLVSEFPSSLENVIQKSLEKEPERRYQSAQEMADALQSFCAEMPEVEQTVIKPPRMASSGDATAVKKDRRFEIEDQEKKSSEEESEKRIESRGKSYKQTLWIILALIAAAGIGYIHLPEKKPPVPEPEKEVKTPEIPEKTPVKQENTTVPDSSESAQDLYRKALELGSNTDSAAVFLRRALEIDPDYYPALRDYGYYMVEKGEYRKADFFLKKALQNCGVPEERKKIQNRLALIHSETGPRATPTPP